MRKSYDGSTKFNEIWVNTVITVITGVFNVSITDKCPTKDVNISTVPRDISLPIISYVVRSMGLNPNVKLRV